MEMVICECFSLQVGYNEAFEFAQCHRLNYTETSAAEATNVDIAFTVAIAELVETLAADPLAQQQSDGNYAGGASCFGF
jgi:hypothetical protein